MFQFYFLLIKCKSGIIWFIWYELGDSLYKESMTINTIFSVNQEYQVFSYLVGIWFVLIFYRLRCTSRNGGIIVSSFFVSSTKMLLGYFDFSDLLRISSSDWTQVDRDHFWSINFHSQFHSFKIRFFKAKVSDGFLNHFYNCLVILGQNHTILIRS